MVSTVKNIILLVVIILFVSCTDKNENSNSLHKQKIFKDFLLHCGGATLESKYASKLDRKPVFYDAKLTTIKNKDGKSLKLGPLGGHLLFDCVKNPAGLEHIVYQNYCTGSGCDDGAYWGIIDPRTLKSLLVPEGTRQNINFVKKFFGRLPYDTMKIVEPPCDINGKCRN